MEDKTVAIGCKGKRHIQQTSIIQRLLHPLADLMLIGLGFHHRQRQTGLMVENNIRRLHFFAGRRLTAHHHLAIPQFHFLTDLGHIIPACVFDRREDKLGNDIGLCKPEFVDGHGGVSDHGAGFWGIVA